MLRYSRHAKRRMALYGIDEEDVAQVVKRGKKGELTKPGRVSFTWPVEGRFKYPLRVVGCEEGEDLLIITAYPLKRGMA